MTFRMIFNNISLLVSIPSIPLKFQRTVLSQKMASQTKIILTRWLFQILLYILKTVGIT